jgi:tetratricopeptide (TPR) repeat protein
MVDTDTPTTYRLPTISGSDQTQWRVALRSNAVQQTTTPAVPKDRQVKVVTPETSSAAFAYAPTMAELTSQLLPAVQRGYNLAERGAFFAARTEFIQVLRRVAQAKDAGSNTEEHARALAAGLRALDEADDFVPKGAQLEAEMDVRVVASSHRTPVLRDYPEDVTPQEAVALYHSYAQEQLAHAAAGEQPGSMALYGLGKVYARLAERHDDDVQYTRGAMTMYAAALGACPDNNLAANELGVLLCRAGHPAEAVHEFERAIDLAPNATAYHNLAVAQQKLGFAGQAAANEQESQRLAALDRSQGAVSRRAGVHWVSPAELARMTQPALPAPVTPVSATAVRPDTSGKTQWR